MIEEKVKKYWENSVGRNFECLLFSLVDRKSFSDFFDVNELSLKKQTKHLHIHVQTDVPLVFTT